MLHKRRGFIFFYLFTARLNTPLDKPLVVLLSWLMSKQKHLKKYAQLYTDQGFDVLTVQVTPWQFMWPKQGAQVGILIKIMSLLLRRR